MDDESLDILVEGVRDGCETAAADLVAVVSPLVLKIVRSHRPRRMSEEDLAQDILIKLFRQLDHYQARPGIPFTHWLSRLAVRTCLDALRAERRRPEWRWSDLTESQQQWMENLVNDADPPAVSEASEARELVELLLDQLPPEDRMILTWLDMEERSVVDVAQFLGWSRSRVKIRAFRARRKLRGRAVEFQQQAIQ